MTATFLVTLNVNSDDINSLNNEADDLLDSLVADGFDVTDVKPWARPSQQGEGIIDPNLLGGGGLF